MDQRMMSQLLETYGFPRGASVSAENANRIREFGASNPDVLERRAMRMRGSGVDDNSDLLQLLMEQTAAAPSIQSQPLPPPPMPTVQASTGRNRRTATAAPETGPDAPLRTGGATMPPQAQRPPPTGDQMTESATGYGQGDTQIPGMQPAPAPPQGPGLLDILLSALGLSATGGAAAGTALTNPNPTGVAVPPRGGVPAVQGPERVQNARQRGGVTDVVDQNARSLGPPEQRLNAPQSQGGVLPPPQQRIGSSVSPGYMESVGDEMETVRHRNASARAGQRRGVQASVDAENAHMATKDEQILQQLLKQEQTRELLRKGGRALGRR